MAKRSTRTRRTPSSPRQCKPSPTGCRTPTSAPTWLSTPIPTAEFSSSRSPSRRSRYSVGGFPGTSRRSASSPARRSSGRRRRRNGERSTCRCMRTSSQVAQYVALTLAGYEPELVPGPVQIEQMLCLDIEGQRCLQYVPSAEQLDEGDTIVAVDGTDIDTIDDLTVALEDNAPGDTVSVTVDRVDVGEVDVDVELMESPDRGRQGDHRVRPVRHHVGAAALRDRLRHRRDRRTERRIGVHPDPARRVDRGRSARRGRRRGHGHDAARWFCRGDRRAAPEGVRGAAGGHRALPRPRRPVRG